ncbi:MAG TPA: hypothetical protein VHS53_06490 [Mucilaginibacter sp.]|nr:hypothetical protein [Mucilaginibacter sp.]
MKKLLLISAIAMSGMLYNTANAQVRLHVGVNLGFPRVVVTAPAPVVYNEPANYDGNENYYYLPDADAYYSVHNQCYYYNDGDAWVSATYLPGAYRDYNWSSMRHYEVRAPRPYYNDDFYRTKFNGAAFAGRYDNRANVASRQMEYNRGRVAYNSQHADHDNLRGRDDFRGHDNFRGRDDSRRGR